MRFNKSNFYYNIESEYTQTGYNIPLVEPFILDDLFTGPIGDTGLRGKEGNVGTIGFKGQKGYKGLKGDKGPIGSRGIIGPQGPPGDKGLPGPKGQKGIRGLRGDIGGSGIRGPVGDRGPEGPIGYAGPMGNRGNVGNKGPQGKMGDPGYKGIFTFKYNECEFTDWTKFIAKSNEIVCPAGKVATRIESKCGCGEIPEKSKAILKCGMHYPRYHHIRRDCQYRLKCCPYDIYDVNESESMIKTRMFYGQANEGEERLLNKIWISLKPNEFNKTVRDYPNGFFDTENLGGTVKIISSDDKKYEEIVYTDECESKFCSKVGQHCIDNKICLNSINEDTRCLKPPCWHKIPEPVNSCDGKCDNLGQYCTKNKVCSMQTNSNCTTPPCWNTMPVLDKCPGKRCPLPGQQCSLGSTKYNMTGFVCKDEVNELPANNKNEWCREPPCWHRASLYTNNCNSNECNIVGQKCGTKDKYNKICLDKPSDNCLNPPCWHSVNDNRICSKILFANNTPVDKDGNECPKEPKLDEDGKELNNALGEPIYEYDKECKKKWKENKLKDGKICEKVPLLDVNGNEIKDSNDETIMVMGECKFEGNCSNIGRRCTIKGTPKFECMDKYKFLDATLPSFDRSKCNNPPCWVPIENSLDPKFTFLDLINNNEFKNEAQINALEGLEQAELKLDVYQFTEDDRKGSITFEQLYNYMQANWIIFEANCIRDNTLLIWKIFTGFNKGTGRMDYNQFSGMMRKLKVETFKYRDNKGRIYPKSLSDEDYQAILDSYVPTDPNDKRYPKKKEETDPAVSCTSDSCDVEGQFCPSYMPGSGGKGYRCCHKRWMEGTAKCDQYIKPLEGDRVSDAENCIEPTCKHETQFCASDKIGSMGVGMRCCNKEWREGKELCDE